MYKPRNNGMKRRMKMKTGIVRRDPQKLRKKVFRGKKNQTPSGLKKVDLKKSRGKPGKVVSKKVSEQAKQRYDKPRSPIRLWNEAKYVVRINMLFTA